MTAQATGSSTAVDDPLSDRALHNADAAVVEIFGMMFGLVIEVDPATDLDLPPVSSRSEALGARTAIIGLSGALRGICQIRMSSRAAAEVAAAMLSSPVDIHDPAANDALGELCNMMTGGWKNSFPQLACDCVLSPPTVISGGDYTVHSRSHAAPLVRTYREGL
jgi:chemotaxis protein CheX